ncbi:uncharacterized protein [Rutidosis leptorrhynchoides]|uniref:uncharacterized protein n=1 Tax=Rutidosis leptorrhynchoides TaxID=125765 RepID=UPI003A98FEDB
MGNILRILVVFCLAYGLKINLAISKVCGIRVSHDQVVSMADWTGCEAGDRLTLIKAVLGGLGIVFSLFLAPYSILSSLEKLHARFFWGGNKNKRKMAWIKWDKILAYFKNGGLEVGTLRPSLMQACWASCAPSTPPTRG